MGSDISVIKVKNIIKSTGLLLYLFVFILASGLTIPENDPVKFTQKFYYEYFKAVDDGSTNPILQQYLSPKLFSLYQEKVKASNDSCFMDVDPFVLAQDFPDRYMVKLLSQKNDSAIVNVTLVYGKDASRCFMISLKRLNQAWKITNIRYDRYNDIIDYLEYRCN